MNNTRHLKIEGVQAFAERLLDGEVLRFPPGISVWIDSQGRPFISSPEGESFMTRKDLEELLAALLAARFIQEDNSQEW